MELTTLLHISIVVGVFLALLLLISFTRIRKLEKRNKMLSNERNMMSVIIRTANAKKIPPNQLDEE